MDGSGMVRLCSMAACRGAGVAGMQLRTIGGSAGEPDESVYPAAQEDKTGFYGFLIDFK